MTDTKELAEYIYTWLSLYRHNGHYILHSSLVLDKSALEEFKKDLEKQLI